MASAKLSGGGVSLLGSRGWRRIVRLPSSRLSIIRREEQNREEGEMAPKKLGGGRRCEVNV